ncbi:hypothetical protein BA895_07260 [Humibacillus sp. DSM 29435]|uniref:DUF6188 family protein n=1 Tax=Humibacillus sp. DSM 29435 TaxID=1869167 RepID=UPI000893512A|nr:DUF6188 family protein [Humibacillus sp. DSM 29435]OFE14946.1 hypothetical protein BA895_07260 [Humibacillus sp. DSM 29435]
MIPSFAGKIVHSIRLDYALKMWTTDNWQLDLNGDGFLLRPDGMHVIDSGTPQEKLPAVLAELVGAEITEVLVAEHGHLAVNFADAQLSVRASPDYEAWELTGPHGERIVCMPGGALASWPASNG